MDIHDLIDEVIARESGYSHHPADRGGPTNMGITQAVARANGYAGDMKAMPRSVAEGIYRRLYWDQPGYAFVAEMSGSVAAELFDTGVNMGVGTATAKSMVLNIVLVHLIGMLGTQVFWGANPRAPIGG